jgi:hypothetical protein
MSILLSVLVLAYPSSTVSTCQSYEVLWSSLPAEQQRTLESVPMNAFLEATNLHGRGELPPLFDALNKKEARAAVFYTGDKTYSIEITSRDDNAYLGVQFDEDGRLISVRSNTSMDQDACRSPGWTRSEEALTEMARAIGELMTRDLGEVEPYQASGRERIRTFALVWRLDGRTVGRGTAGVDIDSESGLVTSFSTFYRKATFQRREPYPNEGETAGDALYAVLANRFGTGIYSQSNDVLSYNTTRVDGVRTYIPTWSLTNRKFKSDGSRLSDHIVIMHPETRAVIMASDMGHPLSANTPEFILDLSLSRWGYAGAEGTLTPKESGESVSGSLRILKSDKAVMVGLYSAETNTFFVGEERYAPSEELAVAMR